MFKLFKKEALLSPKGVEVYDRLTTENKSTNEIIKEIHESFYTEVDKLLAEAKISKSLDTTKQELIDKAAKLKELGFNNTKECIEANKEIDRLNILKSENQSKEKLIRAINYFSFKYPNYKFITEESVKKICQKYNLVYGEVNRYLGTVPDKNLQQIADFKIKDEDSCYLFEDIYHSPYDRSSTGRTMSKKYLTKSQLLEIVEQESNSCHRDYNGLGYMGRTRKECSMEIAAPLKDFNMKGLEVKDFKLSKIEIPDPVVLKPVIFEGQKHYLLVSMWGEVEGDPALINERMN